MATNSDKLKMLGQYNTKTKVDPNEWTPESRGPNLIRKDKIGGKGESSIYEWGSPSDKIPGNRPNIQWSKAAEIKDLGYDANEAKVLQKLLIEKLRNRLKKVSKTKFDVTKLNLGTTDRKKLTEILKKTDYDASQVFKNLNTESKALKRALGSMLQTDADFFAERGVWNLLTANLDRLEGEELFRVVKGLDASISGSKGGLVGHHTSLSASTKLLDQFDEPWQDDFLRLAKDGGYDLGERSLKRIEGLAHKPVLIKGKQTLKGYVAEKLAPLIPDIPYKNGELVVPRGKYPKIDAWLDKMGEISAHGKEYGGTVGYEADAKGLKISTPQQALDNTRNIYDAEKVIQQQAKKLNTNLNKVFNKDFPKKNFTNIDDAADFLLKKANQKNWQPDPVRSNVIAEAKNELGPASSLARKGIDPRAEVDRIKSLKTGVVRSSEDVLDRYLPPKTINKPTIKPKGLNLSKFGKTLAIGTGVAAGTSLIGGPQGHAAGMYAKTGEGKYLKDLSIAAGRDLTVGYGLTTGLSIAGKAAAKGALTKGLVRSAALRTLGGAVAGPLGIPLMIYGAYDTANQFTKAYTGTSINERIKNKAVSLYKNTLKNPELLISDSRADLKKHGILTNYQGGNDAFDATIEAIKKDPEMKESWGLKSHLFMDRA